METQNHILMICGEPSGDLNASLLARGMLRIDPTLRIFAVGGKLLAQAGAEIIYDIKGLSVMGFFDVLFKLPRFLRLKKLILRRIDQEKLKAVILVDFSGFNLRLARAIDRKVPVLYYISPQIWASRSGRLALIKKYISKMIVLFTFERELYKRAGVDVEFAGHPLLDSVEPALNRREFLETFDLDPSKTTIALLPGSRKQEIKHLLPVMLKAASLIRKSLPQTQFVIAKSPHVDMRLVFSYLKKYDIGVKVVENKTYDCVAAADFCLVCSGTATLEVAILQKPFCLMYKMSLLNYLLYRPQVKVPYIGMVNIVAGRPVIPEFIQYRMTASNVAQYVVRILKDTEALEAMRSDLASIRPLLGERGASGRAAKIVCDFLKQ